MCVLAFACGANPRWPLVLIGNRDELHARPSAQLARWDESPHVIAGRDIEAGGSWLGVSDQGRLAVVTNRRNPQGPAAGKASRGALVADWLTASGRYADPGEADLADFNPFNLIATDARGAHFLTNRPEPVVGALGPGIYGLSNGALDEAWPKTDRIKLLLADWLEACNGTVEPLLDALRADAGRVAGPEEVPDGPLFILNRAYGTRCSTVVLVDAEGNGSITERRYDADGGATGETAVGFEWPANALAST